MADDIASLGITVDSTKVDDAKKSLDDLAKQAGTTAGVIESMAKRANVSFEEMANRIKAAKEGMSGVGGSFSEITPAVTSATTAISAATKELANHTNVATQLREGLHGLAPIIRDLGGSMGGLREYAVAARLGLESLTAIAAGALLVSLAKVSDEIARTKNRFDAITGSSELGAKTFNAVKEAARGSGIELTTMATAVEKASGGWDKLNSSSVIFANTGDQISRFGGKLTDTFKTLGQVMQLNLATGTEEKKIFDALASSIDSTGTVTAKAFQTIRDQSPATARFIAQAFNYNDLNAFQHQLELTPITLDELKRRVDLLAPSIQATFDQKPINTVEQATRKLSDRWEELKQTLADNGFGKLASDTLKNLGDTLAQDARDVAALVNALNILKQSVPQVISGATSGAGGVNQSAGAMAAGGLPGLDSGTFSSGGPSIQLDQSTQSFSQALGAAGDLPAFADGGQFTVGGSGGTDSQVVQFKATPGEVVTVATPTGSGIQGLTTNSGGNDVTPSPASQASVKQITDAISQSTITIVSAVDRLTNGVAATTVNPATGLPITSSSSAASNLLAGINASNYSNTSFSGLGALIALSGSNSGRGGGSGGSSAQSAYQQQLRQYAATVAANKAAQQGPSIDPMYAPGLGLSAKGASYGRAPQPGNFPLGSSISPVGAYAPTYGGNGATVSQFQYVPDSFSEVTDATGTSVGNVSLSNIGDFPTLDSNVIGFDQGFDPNLINYGGGSSDMGYFATGGQFQVGGNGGTDTTPIFFHATKGETVTVTPPGVASPVPPNSSGARPDPSQSTSSNTTKVVNMYIHPGIQAEQFIRSRAQIIRGM